jgi:hypothetical protein
VTDRYIPGWPRTGPSQDDQRTLYFRLDPDARWSDGRPVTAHDYVFTLEMMRSPHIIDPFYNSYAERNYESVDAIDDTRCASSAPARAGGRCRLRRAVADAAPCAHPGRGLGAAHDQRAAGRARSLRHHEQVRGESVTLRAGGELVGRRQAALHRHVQLRPHRAARDPAASAGWTGCVAASST